MVVETAVVLFLLGSTWALLASSARVSSQYNRGHYRIEGTLPVNELPPEAIAYLTFLHDVQAIATSPARDSVLDWVVGIAGVGGCVFIARAWAVYSVVSAFLFFHGLSAALDTFQATVGS